MLTVRSNNDGKTAVIEGDLEELADLVSDASECLTCDIDFGDKISAYYKMGKQILAMTPGTPEFASAVKAGRVHGGDAT